MPTPSPSPDPSARPRPRPDSRTAAPHRPRWAIAVAMLPAVLAGLAAAATPAAARSPRPSTVASAEHRLPERRTVTVTGVARVRGTPDVLTMRLGVTSRGRTVGEALDRNTTAARAVVAALLKGGVDERDIQTSSFSIGPILDDRSDEITGYQVSNLVTVALRDLDRAGQLIDRAVEAGGDDVVMHGVSFTFDDASDLIAQARAQAVKRARSQAEQLATAAGVELAEVLTISESSDDVGPVLVERTAAPNAAAAPPPIEPGTEEQSVRVTIVYAIR